MVRKWRDWAVGGSQVRTQERRVDGEDWGPSVGSGGGKRKGERWRLEVERLRREWKDRVGRRLDEN